MGYSLAIGEAELDEEGTGINVPTVTLDNAPAHGDPTDHTNERWPSYSVWSDFCKSFGLMDVMFNERNGGVGCVEVNGEFYSPLIERHPGVSRITQWHVDYVERAVNEYRQKHPDHIAQYPPPKPDAKPIFGEMYREEDLVDDPRFDAHLCRAEWLLFWLKWALANCNRPVFKNT